MLKVFNDFKDIATPIGQQVLAYCIILLPLVTGACVPRTSAWSIDGILTQTISGKSLLAVRIPGLALDIRWH